MPAAGEDHTACPGQWAAPPPQTGVLQPLRKVLRWPKGGRGGAAPAPTRDACCTCSAPRTAGRTDLSAQRRDGPHVAVPRIIEISHHCFPCQAMDVPGRCIKGGGLAGGPPAGQDCKSASATAPGLWKLIPEICALAK
ncbi:hypothetical protein SDC9_06487 [bioreactor metagenome]|uniref:Uncharacterized protein n=1 Tax=bioreactor metagenome TaxID=1076179 RepID=A0A644T1Z5_9ZZZZ